MNDSEKPVTPPSEPVVPPQPAAVPPAQAAAPAAVPAAVPAPPAPGGSKKTLIIVLAAVGGALLLGVVLAVCWFTLWSPQAQAKRLSNSFMKAMTTGNVTKAVELSGDASAKGFLQTASDKVKGSYKMSESTYESSKGYYLYTLSGADKDYARTIITKEDGKLVVNSFVYSDSKLRLIPGSSDTTSTTKEETTTTTKPEASTATTAQACLVQDDYKWLNYDKEPDSVTYDTTYDPGNNTFNKTVDMFFEPDSTKETSFLDTYDDWADFAKHASDKQWVFHLEGSTYGSDAGTTASKQLAAARAQKVKDQLVQRGVPASRIIIEAPHNYGAEVQEDNKDRIYRRVEITVDPNCTGTSASSNSSSSSTGNR